MIKNFALIGNQNSGKTTLFNNLTGSRQKVGNWAGVTVEKKEGFYRKDKNIKITDLPGLYSLSADTLDERVVTEFLSINPPDVIINVLDGTNLKRGLRLTLELKAKGIPMVVAVNMADELKRKGINLDFDTLSKGLNLPIVPISAIKNYNVDKLIITAVGLNKAEKEVSIVDEKSIDDEIEELIGKSLKTTLKKSFTETIDKVLLNKYLGIPIFFLVMLIIYFVSINLGGLLGEKISLGMQNLSINTAKNLNKIGVSKFLINLICGAIFNGIGTVISFLPQILILFLFMTLLEESGYMSRVAFLFDRLFNYVGLSGKSLIPVILSCGCAVTGTMSTKTIENDGERKSTIILSPFMPCSAKLAVFSFLSELVFSGSALIATSLYFLSILSVILGGLILKKFKIFSKGESVFALDMPVYRFPSLKNLFYVLIEKTKDYLIKAGTVIFAVSVMMWLLTNLGFSGYTNGDIEKSFLKLLGDSFKYIFYPIGIKNWQISVSIISSIFAKEAVIETFSFLCVDIGEVFLTPFSAYAFLVFILLSPPCAATLVACKKELKDNKSFFIMIVFEFVFAYLMATIINLIGVIYYRGWLTTFIISVIILLIFIFSLKAIFKNKCFNCKNCSKCKKEKR